MKILENLFYTESHEWIAVEGEMVTIGITDYAQDALGEVVYVEMPEVDTTYEKDDVLAEIESAKAASEVFAPFDIEVTEINEDLEDAYEKINEVPYESWFIKGKLLNEGQLSELMNAKGYETFIKEV